MQSFRITARRLSGFVPRAPKDDVGIMSMATYIPKRYVRQEDLETRDGVSSGKYTIGLGQSAMSFCSDNEDINSLCLNAVSRLLEETGLRPEDIGRLEVGTETLVDKSKAVKTTLMDLFAPAQAHSIEGIDSVNACYGGVQALHNACDWVHSPWWNGKYAIVVAGDIAVYEAGPARPTGGAGAVAVLVGKGAPLVVEAGQRSFHFENAYDFYKPDGTSEYAVVDGHLSNACYIRALDNCFARYAQVRAEATGRATRLADFDHFVAHAPYNKLVRKSYARLAMLDAAAHGAGGSADLAAAIEAAAVTRDAAIAGQLPEATYTDRALEKAFLAETQDAYEAVVGPSTVGPANVGNTYTASVLLGLASLLSEKAGSLASGTTTGMYSYGSGLASSMFSLRVEDAGAVASMAQHTGLAAALADREVASPEQFEDALLIREKFKYTVGCGGLTPKSGTDGIREGSYYLAGVDELARRTYKKL